MPRKPLPADDEEATEREYLETRQRLSDWRKGELERRAAPVPKAVVPKAPKEKPFQSLDPLGIGSAGTQKDQR